MCLLWKRRTQERQIVNSRLQHVQTAERLVTQGRCVETRTNMRLRRMQMNPVQKSLSKKFGAWLFKTLSTMVTVIVPRTGTYLNNNMTRSKFKQFREHLHESKVRKVITNIETGQHSGEDRDGRTGSSRRTKNMKEFVNDAPKDPKLVQGLLK